jgi:hypothetical protein
MLQQRRINWHGKRLYGHASSFGCWPVLFGSARVAVWSPGSSRADLRRLQLGGALKDSSWTADRSGLRNWRGIAASRVNGSRFDMGAPIPGWWIGPGTADDPAVAERGPGSIRQLRGRDRCPVTGTAGGPAGRNDVHWATSTTEPVSPIREPPRPTRIRQRPRPLMPSTTQAGRSKTLDWRRWTPSTPALFPMGWLDRRAQSRKPRTPPTL